MDPQTAASFQMYDYDAITPSNALCRSAGGKDIDWGFDLSEPRGESV